MSSIDKDPVKLKRNRYINITLIWQNLTTVTANTNSFLLPLSWHSGVVMLSISFSTVKTV